MDAATLAANQKIDPRNSYLWRFRLQRLEAEPIWDSILYTSNDLDLAVGGSPFSFPRTKSRNFSAAGRQLQLR
jgi:hypothetical protein